LIILCLCLFLPDDTRTGLILPSDDFPLLAIPRTYVVLAANLDTPDSISNYGLLAPLTSFIWNRVLNSTPIVMLATQKPGRLTTQTEVSFARLVRQAGGRVHCISISDDSSSCESGVALKPNLVGATLITALQVSRIASIALQYLNDDDVIVTTDADIWPMSRSFWKLQLSRSLKPDNEDFLVYNGPFLTSQLKKKDCNFLALTSLLAKTRTWRGILSFWVESLKYAPSPRKPVCNFIDDNPTLPWYNYKERSLFLSNKKSGQSSRNFGVSFPKLLQTFLHEGRKMLGFNWEDEILRNHGKSYKDSYLWHYDQILVSEMVLSSNITLLVNDDVRRLDKFGKQGTDSDFFVKVDGKSHEDFTDVHLDGVEEKNWGRLEAMWYFALGDDSISSDALDFFQDVRSFYDKTKVAIIDELKPSTTELGKKCDEI
jgi:hypothetical protein